MNTLSISPNRMRAGSRRAIVPEAPGWQFLSIFVLQAMPSL